MVIYLYRLYGPSSELLYVGITRNLSTRLTNHRAEKSWWPEVEFMQVNEYTTLEAAMAAERLAIQAESPQYNIRNDSNHPHQRQIEIIPPLRRRNSTPLPKEEVEHLLHLTDDQMVIDRAYELYRFGWPMIEIIKHTRLHPSSSYLRTKFAESLPVTTGHPIPELPATSREASRIKSLGWLHSAREITSAEQKKLAALAEISKKHRASYSSTHYTAVAVAEFIAMIQYLHDVEKITLPDIAKAAGVTPSTIRRRYRTTKL